MLTDIHVHMHAQVSDMCATFLLRLGPISGLSLYPAQERSDLVRLLHGERLSVDARLANRHVVVVIVEHSRTIIARARRQYQSPVLYIVVARRFPDNFLRNDEPRALDIMRDACSGGRCRQRLGSRKWTQIQTVDHTYLQGSSAADIQ